MSDPYQRVEPTPFDAPGDSAASAPAAPFKAGARRAWLLTAGAGLGLLILLVIFALPRWVGTERVANERAERASPASPPGATARSAASPAEASPASPFADAVAAKARSAAQDLLAELLPLVGRT